MKKVINVSQLNGLLSEKLGVKASKFTVRSLHTGYEVAAYKGLIFKKHVKTKRVSFHAMHSMVAKVAKKPRIDVAIFFDNSTSDRWSVNCG